MSYSTRTVAAALTGLALLPGAAAADHTGFSPASRTKTVETGKTEKLDYKLELAAQSPTRAPSGPLDVYLLVDTSDSMRSRLPAVRAGLADAVWRLARRHPDLRVGVGEFRTTAPREWLGGTTYRRLLPASPSYFAHGALERLGADRSELPALVGNAAHTVAIEESVTGAGHGVYARRGHEAGFRSHARKVVVVLTDDAFSRDATQPTRDEAIAALNAADADVVGLALSNDARADLVAVARGTGSTAGERLDCGADSVPAGQPAACVTRPELVGAVLESAFGTTRRTGELRFVAQGTGVRRLEPSAPRLVDVTRRTKMDVKLEVHCAAGDAGRTHSISLRALLDGRVVATASALVRCKWDD